MINRIKNTGLYKILARAWLKIQGWRYARRVERDRKKMSMQLFSEYFIGEPAIDLPHIDSPDLEAFPVGSPVPWLDHEDASIEVGRLLDTGGMDAGKSELALDWIENGVVIVPGFFEPDYLDTVWASFDRHVEQGKIELEYAHDDRDPHYERVINPHHDISELGDFLNHPRMTGLAEFFLGRRVAPYQTILAPKGSNQLAHSDSIHMSTYPRGYLVAIWVAFEDIHPDSGPLEYYPGSHNLPYVSRGTCGIPADEYYKSGYKAYVEKYEPYIQDLIADRGLEPAYFEAHKGDVLVWHANLLHGGKPREDISLTRKSVVAHYFGAEALCYHDISGYYSGRFQEFADRYAEELKLIR